VLEDDVDDACGAVVETWRGHFEARQMERLEDRAPLGPGVHPEQRARERGREARIAERGTTTGLMPSGGER